MTSPRGGWGGLSETVGREDQGAPWGSRRRNDRERRWNGGSGLPFPCGFESDQKRPPPKG
jgi:hypothetical protein